MSLQKRLWPLVLMSLLGLHFLVLVGCSGSGEPSAVSDQDELSAYLDENGDDTELDPDDE